MHWEARYDDCRLQWSSCLTCPNGGIYDCHGAPASNLGYQIVLSEIPVARVAKRSGISEKRLREYISGERNINRIPAENLFRLADVLDCPAECLMESKVKREL